MDFLSRIRLKSGREMPVIGLGTWELAFNVADTVEYAIDAGYRMMDTSGDYGTQEGIGEAIKRTGLPREELYIVSKIEEDDDPYEAISNNVAEMALEYADLMLIHRPPESGAGEELWQGLLAARGSGLVRDIGVSNYSVALIKALAENSGELPAVNQVEWSPFGWDEELKQFAHDNGIVIVAYSPLTRTRRLKDKRLIDIAAHYDKTPAQVLIRWNLQSGVVPIPKANERKHIDENIGVFDFVLSDEDILSLNSMDENFSALRNAL